MKKQTLKVVHSCKNKKGCSKTSWELSQGTTFQDDPIIKKKAA